MHTGTHFCVEFLKQLGLERHKNGQPFANKYMRIHARPYSLTHKDDLDRHLNSAKVIVPARDPYLSCIRHFKAAHFYKTMNAIEGAWDTFLDRLPEIDYYVIDVATPEEKRYDVLAGAVDHIGLDRKEHESTIQRYADGWKPLNTTDTEAKTKYIEAGKIPEALDEQKLARAVAWYNSLK